MGLSLHHLKGHFVVVTVAVDGAGPYHELLLLVVLDQLFVLHFHHDLALVVEHLLAGPVLEGRVRRHALVVACLLGSSDRFLLFKHKLRLNFKIFFLLDVAVGPRRLGQQAVSLSRWPHAQAEWIDFPRHSVSEFDLVARRRVVDAWSW